jgi:hypothetical protein
MPVLAVKASARDELRDDHVALDLVGADRSGDGGDVTSFMERFVCRSS